MSDAFEKLIEQVDTLLSRAACDVVLGGDDARARVQAALSSAADRLASGRVESLRDLEILVTEAAAQDPALAVERLAAIEAMWSDWKSTHHTPAPRARHGDEELAMLVSDPELASMFIAEATDHLNSIEALVLQVEARPDDASLLNDVFRPFHTIKGNAGALGVSSVQGLAHAIESLLDLGRDGRHAIGRAEIELILQAVDLLTTMIGSLTARMAGLSVPDTRSESAALISAVERLIAGSPADGAEHASPAGVDWPDDRTPAPGGDPAATPVHEPGLAQASRSSMPVDESSKAIRIDTRKLDNLVDIVGELVIAQSMIQEDAAFTRAVDERLARNLAQLKRITTDLQRNAMSMRMTPVRQTFQKMVRLVRDLSRQSGKPVDLALSGEDTELDRKIVENITDPLMHMVRNSVDHGIELPDARRRAGKPGQARISLSACHEGGSIVISVSDDGAGLDVGAIRRKALAQGLIRADQSLSAAEIHELIFAPGFTTAERVTEISGRGVGMDVVRRNIEMLRGRIEIQSTAGVGTTFVIKLPLTLAIVEGLLLRVGSQRFVLPTFCIRESLRPRPEQVHVFQGRRRVIQVRDALLPMVHLGELFGAAGPLPDPSDATVVVIEDNGRRVALTVDELLGKQEVVIKSLGDSFAAVRGVAGGAILGDGRVGLILDAGGLVELMDQPVASAA